MCLFPCAEFEIPTRPSTNNSKPLTLCTRHSIDSKASDVAINVAHTQASFPITEDISDDLADQHHERQSRYLYWSRSLSFEFRNSSINNNRSFPLRELINV
jgi:hypothetical protein